MHFDFPHTQLAYPLISLPSINQVTITVLDEGMFSSSLLCERVREVKRRERERERERERKREKERRINIRRNVR